MTLGILDKINYGYRQLEPVIVGLMAMHKSFMLIGRHGTGKTRLARALSAGYESHRFRLFDARQRRPRLDCRHPRSRIAARRPPSVHPA